MSLGLGYYVGRTIRREFDYLEDRINKIDEFLQDVCEDFHKSRIELECRVEEVEKSGDN